jgi:hypothetical protein
METRTYESCHMEKHGEKLRRTRNYVKIETDGDAWLSAEPHKVEAPWEEDGEEGADCVIRRKVNFMIFS